MVAHASAPEGLWASSGAGLLQLFGVAKLTLVAARVVTLVVVAARSARSIALATPSGSLVVGGALEAGSSRSSAVPVALAGTWACRVVSRGRAAACFLAAELAADNNAPPTSLQMDIYLNKGSFPKVSFGDHFDFRKISNTPF